MKPLSAMQPLSKMTSQKDLDAALLVAKTSFTLLTNGELHDAIRVLCAELTARDAAINVCKQHLNLADFDLNARGILPNDFARQELHYGLAQLERGAGVHRADEMLVV